MTKEDAKLLAQSVIIEWKKKSPTGNLVSLRNLIADMALHVEAVARLSNK